ncbi:translation elongation factor Ts [Candidatus Gromoviella agglomerans]|uniref:translation elongation factor Ts n=1 Tax=Candidatus Gromoviella agglomerans TaxID=2806609 RepID=UPI001E4A7F60|nr:translation elongation factor Ts [Candidatus Gromoviella agglomerans]UFX98447.1 Elongation factor Ts [Candidatus Gromoviella agglomerans]
MNTELIKKLRDMTSAGLSDCKKALNETDGNLDEALKWLRARSLSILNKKSDRETSEGCIVLKVFDNLGVMSHVKCETDFAAKSDSFLFFVRNFINFMHKNCSLDRNQIEEHFKSTLADVSNEGYCALSLGENITCGDFFAVKGENIFSYVHDPICSKKSDIDLGVKIGKVGVILSLKSDCDTSDLNEIATNLCMHIAYHKPQFMNRDEVSQKVIDEESSVLIEKLKQSGIENDPHFEARLDKILRGICLNDQNFVKDEKISVKTYLMNESMKFGKDIVISDFMVMSVK